MFKDSNMSKQVTVVRSSAFCSQAHLGKVKMIQNSSNPQALPDRSGHCRFPLFPPVSTFQSKFCQGSKANATGAIWLPWLVVHWLSFRSYLCHPVSMQLSGIEFNKRNTKWPSCGQAKQDAAALRLECGHNLWVWGRSPDRGPLEGAARLSTKHARRLQGLRCLATRGAFPYCRKSQANLCLPFCSALFASKTWTWHDMTWLMSPFVCCEAARAYTSWNMKPTALHLGILHRKCTQLKNLQLKSCNVLYRPF